MFADVGVLGVEIERNHVLNHLAVDIDYERVGEHEDHVDRVALIWHYLLVNSQLRLYLQFLHFLLFHIEQ